jgi:hypothetical protein
MIYRDAANRASALNDESEAARLMDDALRTGDDTLVRAIAAQAFANRWTELTDAYVQEVKPDAAAAASELASLTSRAATTAAFVQNLSFLPTAPTGIEQSGRALSSEYELRSAASNLGIEVDYDTPARQGSLLQRIASGGNGNANPYSNDTGMSAGDAA